VEKQLSKRQAQVLKLLADGLANKEIASKLGISPRTVEFHRIQIQRRTGLHGTAALIRYAIQHRLIDDDPD